MYAGEQSIGAVGSGFAKIGFILFGLGIFQQKNFSPIIAGLIAISGIFTLIMCLIDYENQLIGIGFIGVTLSFASLGVSLLRSKE